jgi:pyruvate, water dikinase
VEDPAAASGHHVLRQDLPVLPWSALLVTGKGRVYADGHAQVRFKPLSGVTDASGGVIWRAQDGVNYYLCRANALENNFEIYTMKDGVRTTISETVVDPPALNEWHVIDVWFHGNRFRAMLDGKDVVEATDDTWSSGWCGLWTKADAVTSFDGFEITPEGADASGG